jgi:GDP-L-fucose synthase
MICAFIGFDGEVVWDTSKPDGQPKRCLDVTRARKEFGFEAKTDFKEGLRTTIDWYEANRCVLSKIKKDNGSSGAT